MNLGGLEELIDNEDFYSLLNVEREATQEELKNAYHKLCVIYHPDKHDEKNQKHASDIFSKLQEAYSVLSDPTKRHIYNEYGKAGLNAEWRLVERKKTAEEMRMEYEQIQRMRDQQRLDELTRPEGSFKVGINATSLFDDQFSPDSDEYYEDILILPEISTMAISQSVSAPLTLSSTATLTGSIDSVNGNGSGEASLLVKRNFDNSSWGEAELGASDQRNFNIAGKYYRSFSHGIFGVARLPVQFAFDGMSLAILVPNTMLSVGRTITPNLLGSIDLTTTKGFTRSNLASNIIYNSPNDYRIAGKLQLGIPHSFFLASYSKQLPHDAELQLNLKAGTFGAIFQYGLDHQVSEHSVVSAQMSVGSHVGVSLKLKLTRASHVYQLPIQLSDDLNLAAIFYGSLLPVAVYSAVQLLVVRPHLKKEKLRKAQEEEELMADEILKNKNEAESVISMMQETCQRKINVENRKKGLIVIEALYGSFVSTENNNNPLMTKLCDVTIPLQTLVESSKLQLPGQLTKSGLPGFYDPCPATDKRLKVTYTFHNKMHRVIVDDHEALRIPLKSHLVEDIGGSGERN